jgi:hypothetical protein
MLLDVIYPSLARFVKPISVPIGDSESLFSLWQESKRKDIERFLGVFKNKFNFFNRPIPFACMEDIIHSFYCCVILHYMAVMERVNNGVDDRESHVFYDCVDIACNNAIAEESRVETLAMQFVQREAENVRQRDLELRYLSALGINVLDLALPADAVQLEN